jgi:hypothetical protein
MSVISTIPETRIVLPSSVAGFDNGRLPGHALRDPGDGRGAMCLIASYALQAMVIAALADGIRFGSTGRYRTYARQVAMFGERYVTRDTGGPSKMWNGVMYWQRPGVATAATPGASNHGMGCADDVCELDPDGRIIAITNSGLGWLRDNGADFGFALEDRGEPWHWHTVFGDVLTVRAMQVLSFCGVAWPAWMGTLPPAQPQPQPEPIVVALPDPVALPPVDLPNGVYGLVGYAIAQIDPPPVLSVDSRAVDDPLHTQFLQAVLRFEVARFALWFAVTGEAADDAHGLYLHAAHQTATALAVDGDYGPRTAECVEFVQRAFGDASYGGHQLGPMVPDGAVGPQTWPLILQCSTKQWWPLASAA